MTKKTFRKNIGTWKNILYLVGVGSQIPDSRKKESEWVLPEWLVYFPHSATTLASHASFPRTTVLQYSCLFWPGVSFATILSSSIISILSPAHTSFVKFRTLSCRNSNDLIVSSNTVRNKLPSRSSSHSPRTATSDAKVFFFFFFHYALAAAGGFYTSSLRLAKYYWRRIGSWFWGPVTTWKPTNLPTPSQELAMTVTINSYCGSHLVSAGRELYL